MRALHAFAWLAAGSGWPRPRPAHEAANLGIGRNASTTLVLCTIAPDSLLGTPETGDSITKSPSAGPAQSWTERANPPWRRRGRRGATHACRRRRRREWRPRCAGTSTALPRDARPSRRAATRRTAAREVRWWNPRPAETKFRSSASSPTSRRSPRSWCWMEGMRMGKSTWRHSIMMGSTASTSSITRLARALSKSEDCTPMVAPSK